MGFFPGVIYLLTIQLFIFLCLTVCVHGVKLSKWQAHGFCGDRISESKSAGAVVFKVDKLRARHGHGECKVVVAPETLPGSHGRGKVLLYFEFFELPGTCSDFSVTLLDGSSHKAPRVSGAPNPLCHHNTSLTKTRKVFNTSGSEFTVLFRWRNLNKWKEGIVVLTFASYYDGPCDHPDDVVMCANKQCIDSAYHCHYDIDTCGHEEEEICEKLGGSIGDGLLRMVLALGIFAVVCALCGLVTSGCRS